MKARGFVSLLTFSEKRTSILRLLSEKSRNLKEIRDALKVSSPAIIPRLRELIRVGLIDFDKKTGKYYLTNAGRLCLIQLRNFEESVSGIERNIEFWNEHDISGIPPEFLNRIFELGEYKIVKSTHADVFEPHKEFINLLSKSKEIMGVSPIFHPEYPEVFLKLAKTGAATSLIITDTVLKTLITRGYRDVLEDWLKIKNSRMYIFKGELKVAFTVTDRFLSLGLFHPDGVYDTHTDLISTSKTALKWGMDLFEHFKSKSKKISVATLKKLKV